MWILWLLLVAILTLFILSNILIYKQSYKILKKYVKNKTILWLLSAVPIILIIIGLLIDFINAMVVYIHFIEILYFTKLVFFIIKKTSKKGIHESISLGISVLLTVIIMCKAYYNFSNVKKTNYEVFTSKKIGTENIRLVQISDSHLGTTMSGEKFTQYIEEINNLEPDIVVITGDFIDDQTPYEDLKTATEGLGKLKTKYGIYFVFGNHDKGYYNNREYDEEDIIKILQDNNVKILEDECVDIAENVILIGRQDKKIRNRKSMQDLITDIDKNKYLIVLDHQPGDYDNEMKSNVDLVLSGHTHGGQLIPIGQLGVLFRINDKIYGMEKRNNTTFIVNAGISDWALKFKTGAISEYVVIDIGEEIS